MQAPRRDRTGKPVRERGGAVAQATTITVLGPDGTVLDTPRKTSRLLAPGTVVRVETAGGGGFGDPAERSAELAAWDRAEGRLG